MKDSPENNRFHCPSVNRFILELVRLESSFLESSLQPENRGAVGLFDLKRNLETIPERDVDLVTPDAHRESVRAEILEEAIDLTP